MATKTLENTEVELKNEVATMLGRAKDLVVKDQDSLGIANEFLVGLSKLRKKRVAWFKDLVDAANKTHKALTKRRSEALEPIDETDKAVRAMTGTYVAKEKERERKAQEKLDKIAEERAAKEEAKLLKKAEKEEDPEKKAELEEKAENVYVEPKIATPTVEKTSRVGGGSVSFTPDIEVEVIDEPLFLKAIIDGNDPKVPATVYEFKPAKIKAWVKTMGIKQGQVPGIRIKEVQKQSVRGG